MATAHLIHGYLGVGKTTFAKQLEAATGGILLSADEWYLDLFSEGPEALMDVARWNRLDRRLTATWPAILRAGADVILDFGFWHRSGRDEARRLAEGAGGAVRLYVLECDEEVARARCRTRNADPGASFLIDDAAYDLIRELRGFEAVQPDELPIRIDTTAGVSLPGPILIEDREGCLACDLSAGRRQLPGGLIHASSHWRVEHCIGPLGVGTLIVKPIRHVEQVGDLTAHEADELGPLLRKTARIVCDLNAAGQVYVCLWSHGPVHIHFVVQPETGEAVAEHEAYGPKLQAAMFGSGVAPDPDLVVEFAGSARSMFGASAWSETRRDF